MQSGTRLGPYEIVSRIGAGGMGEVWRARDTRLGRDVAVKILPAEFAQDAKLKIRFEREAKTISQLSHPNICTLFDVGENYIVMELLEGETLAERLVRGALSLTEVVRYGVQLGEALGKAHRDGVVHRDLKPGNIMLTKSGAKLLDFGLAKSTTIAPSAESQTLQKPLTEEGTIVGTFQYMAPEQLAGEEPDARSDIFALGAVLYEMATGKRAFEGKNRTSLIGAIVSGEPRAIRELQPLTPPALEHVIMRCLEKDRDDRWQSAADIAEELRWISQAGSQAGVASVVPRKWRWREWLMMAALAASLAAAGAMAWLWWRAAPADHMSIEASIDMEPSSGMGYWMGPPAFSPDGKTLAFAAADKSGKRMLWIRSLEGSTPHALANTEGASSPFWSPDGKTIAFRTAGKLKTIPAGGGETDDIADAGVGVGGTWNRDGVILYSIDPRSQLLRVTPGGEPATVLDPQAFGFDTLRWPRFLPDGKHFIVYATGSASRQNRQPDGLWIASVDGAERPGFLTASDSNGAYVEPGWLLFVRGGVLRAQRLAPKTLRLSGDPRPIAPVQVWANFTYAIFDVSSTGLLAYQKPRTVELSELQLRRRSGELVKAIGRGGFWSPSLSCDGRRIAADRSDETGLGDIWVLNLDNGSQARLSFDPGNETSPVWSPDNETVAYVGATVQNREAGILTKRADGVSATLKDDPGFSEAPTDWSRDGSFVAYCRWGRGQRPGFDVLVLNVATRKTTGVATSSADEAAAVFSPDSKWIAYQSDESGRIEVYVQPFLPTGAKHQVSVSGGHNPRWRLKNEIDYVSDDGHFTSVRVDTTKAFSVAPPETFPLVVDDRGHFGWCNYDVAADGTVLVNSNIHDNPQPLTLVTNWTRRLEAAAKK